MIKEFYLYIEFSFSIVALPTFDEIVKDRTWSVTGINYDLTFLLEMEPEQGPTNFDAFYAMDEANNHGYYMIDSALLYPSTKGVAYFAQELHQLHKASIEALRGDN